MNKLSKEIINKKITYKELCYLFDEKTRTDSRKKSKQLEKFSHYCNFNIEGKGRGTKYIITEIYDTPKEIKETRGGANNLKSKYEDIFTKKERNNEFDGYYVYAHCIDGEYIYIGKGCKMRAIKSMYQRFEKDIYDKVEIKILARFENEIDALTYEKEMIDYYKSLGQCKYNDEIYHIGNMYDKEIKLQKEYDKLVNERELLVQKLNIIDLQIEDLKNKLT